MEESCKLLFRLLKSTFFDDGAMSTPDKADSDRCATLRIIILPLLAGAKLKSAAPPPFAMPPEDQGDSH